MELPRNRIRWLFDRQRGPRHRFIPRWLFLRALAAIYFSAFFSLLFQIQGLIGPRGILPAGETLQALVSVLGRRMAFWAAPSLFWISSTSHMLSLVVWAGLIASIAAFLNLWPRHSLLICFVCFLSFVSAAGAFSAYQSDGMLLEAGFLALFFAPRGLLPGWGTQSPPSRAAYWLLLWEWFRIYFQSGVVKLASGDLGWRHLTAMDDYYQNSPLPTWLGYYANHAPEWVSHASAAATLVLELGLVFMVFFPRRIRLICFCIVTPWEIAVILTGNYAFLNYIVLSLGFLLLDDAVLARLIPTNWVPRVRDPRRTHLFAGVDVPILGHGITGEDVSSSPPLSSLKRAFQTTGFAFTALFLTWVSYATTAELLAMFSFDVLPSAPVRALEPFRIANQYGLFAVMTHGRYEIEFQGSNDGQNWTPYIFRYKPQLLNEAPGIYAPYQPRFDWNLWFASLGDWQQNDIIPLTQQRLLQNSPAVLSLFRANPFAESPPRYVRSVLWQYWFTSLDDKRHTGNWWRRSQLGIYSPVLTLAPDGSLREVAPPDDLPPHD